MMNRALRCVAAVFAVVAVGALFLGGVHAQRFEFPGPDDYVSDFADVLSSETESTLETKLYEFEQSDTTQILVITIDNLPENTTLEQFVPELTDDYPQWRAGQEEFDNGVIFTVVVEAREMRIDTGYGVEGALPDITARMILDYDVRPLFRDGDYDGGVTAGVDSIIEAVRGEYTADTSGSAGDGSEAEDTFLGILFSCCPFFLVIFLPYFAAFLGRTKSWWLGGVLGFVGGLVVGVLIGIFGAGLGMFRGLGMLCLPPIMGVLGLLFDFILSKNYKLLKSSGKSTGWVSSWGGFSGGGSSFSGGGSSGGFSAGGGSFGGGGASSSW